MSPEQAVRTRLLAIGAVTALVGTRIYQMKLPQATSAAAIRVQPISEIDTVHLRGGRAVSRSRIQVDAYVPESAGGDAYAAAVNVANAIFGDGAGSGLVGWTGVADGVEIAGCFRQDRSVDYESDQRLVRVRQDFIVWWRV